MRAFALPIAPIALFALSALSACTPGLPFAHSPDVPEGCRQQVYDDPAVKAAIVEANNGQSQDSRVEGLALQKQAEASALRRCLSGQGILPPGGVEPLKLN